MAKDNVVDSFRYGIHELRNVRSVLLQQVKVSKYTTAINNNIFIKEDINVAWSPDGNYVAVGNKEDCVTIIDGRKYLLQIVL